MFFLFFSSSAFTSDSVARGKQVSRLYFPPSRFDGIFGDACLSCHQDDVSSLFGFQRQKLSPLLLIEQLMHLLIFFCPIVLLHIQESIISPSFGQLV